MNYPTLEEYLGITHESIRTGTLHPSIREAVRALVIHPLTDIQFHQHSVESDVESPDLGIYEILIFGETVAGLSFPGTGERISGRIEIKGRRSSDNQTEWFPLEAFNSPGGSENHVTFNNKSCAGGSIGIVLPVTTVMRVILTTEPKLPRIDVCYGILRSDVRKKLTTPSTPYRFWRNNHCYLPGEPFLRHVKESRYDSEKNCYDLVEERDVICEGHASYLCVEDESEYCIRDAEDVN